jgi:adenosylhomocysteine nucleosidase
MIAILYALEDEVAGVHEHLTDQATLLHPWARIERGVLDGQEILLVKCGAGKVLSAMTAQSIILNFKPKLIAVCGISGALNPDYERGDLVIGSDFIQHDIRTEYFGFEDGQVPFTDYRIIPGNPELITAALKLQLNDGRIHSGRIVSGDQFISGDAGARLRTQFAADVVDMESAAVAFVCHLHSMPLIVARTISDRADTNAAKDFGDFLSKASQHVTLFVHNVVREVMRGGS